MKFSGSRLRQIRDGANLTRAALATQSGISKGTIKRLENDQDVSTTTTTVERLAYALGVSPADLFESNGTGEAAA